MRCSFFLAAALTIGSIHLAVASPILPSGYTDLTVATLPGPDSNFYGDIATDTSGNVYVTGGISTSVYKVAPGGIVSSFAQAPGDGLALGLEVVGPHLYFGSEGSTLSEIALSGGAVSPVATLNANSPMGVAYSAIGGNKLYIAESGGLSVYDIDHGTVGTVSQINTLLSAVVTGKDGRLYAADYNNGQLIAYDPSTNTLSTVRSGIPGIAGLAVDPISGDIYAVSEGTGAMLRISADGSTVSTFATNLAIDGGYYPTGLQFAPDGSGLYILEPDTGSTFSLHEITGFEAVPEPGTIAILGTALLAIFGLRRKASNVWHQFEQ